MEVKGHPTGRSWNRDKQAYEDHQQYLSCRVEVGFPANFMHVKSQDLDEIAVQLMEKALLGGEEVNMPAFVKPEFKSPKIYRDLMDQFLGRPVAPKRRRKKETNNE
jgi:hypothetical protein